MSERITNRIIRDLGTTDLAEVLSKKFSGSELHSLLLAVLKRRIGKTETYQLVASSPVTKECGLDARLLNRLECVAYEVASEYDAIELSPLSPLGAVSVLTGLDQGNVLSTIRAFECASDPTVGLALECARRTQEPRQQIATDATVHQPTSRAVSSTTESSVHLALQIVQFG